MECVGDSVVDGWVGGAGLWGVVGRGEAVAFEVGGFVEVVEVYYGLCEREGVRLLVFGGFVRFVRLPVQSGYFHRLPGAFRGWCLSPPRSVWTS